MMRLGQRASPRAFRPCSRMTGDTRASASASQERSMSLKPHRHNSKLSTFMQSAKYFVVPVTELR